MSMSDHSEVQTKNEVQQPETQQAVANTGSSSQSPVTGSSVNVQKLNGTNFLPWKRQILIILKLRGLEDAITEENVDKTKDLQATLLLLETMDASHGLQVQTEPTARKIMQCLEQQYANASENNLHRLLSAYFNFKKNPTDSIFQHVGKLKELRARLASLGEVQSDSLFQANLINSLPSEYKDVSLTWNSTPSSLKTTEFLVNILQEREEMSKRENEKTALLMKRTPRRLTSKEIEEKKKNTYCGKCGAKGHWWQECKNPPKAGYKEKREGTDNDKPKESEKGRPHFSGNMGAVGPELRNKWQADTGATTHMCNQLRWFKTIEAINDEVTVGDGSLITALGRGTVEVETIVDGIAGSGQLTDVLYIPELATNLVSVGTLAEKGITALFLPEKCILSKDEFELITGRKINNKLYELDMKAVITNPDIALIVRGAKSRSDWHKALGHPGEVRLNKILNDEDFGLKIIEPQEPNEECSECPPGKGKHQPHPEREKSEKEPGASVHLDLSGKNKESLSGYYYYLVCKDEATEYCHVYFLKEKSETTRCVDKLMVEYECDGKHKVTEVISDNGSEFVNEKMKWLFLKERVLHRTSTPRTPQQNGLIERAIGSITSMARTILLASRLPEGLWPEALETACYLSNRLPTTKSDSTPYERYYGRKSYLKHLEVFGTEVHIIANWEYRHKWAARTAEGFLVGYTSRRNTFKIYVPAVKRVIETADVYWKPHSREKGRASEEDSIIVENAVVPMNIQVPERSYNVIPDKTNKVVTDGVSETGLDTSKDIPLNEQAISNAKLSESIERRLNVLNTFFEQWRAENKGVENSEGQKDKSVSKTDPEPTPSTSYQPIQMTSSTPLKESEVRNEQPELSSIASNPQQIQEEASALDEEDEQQSRNPFRGWAIPRSPTKLRPRDELKKPKRFLNYLILHQDKENPETFEEAVSGPNSKAWMDAIRSELDAHEANKTWRIIERPAVGCTLTANKESLLFVLLILGGGYSSLNEGNRERLKKAS